MRTFEVKIELDGAMLLTGRIACESSGEARFTYDRDYLERGDSAPISASLPLQEGPFSAQATKNFFDGLLPEGFTRRAVANWMHVDETDYLGLLYGLGQECLGAIQITDGSMPENPSYEKLSVEQVRQLAREGAAKSAQIIAKSHLSLTGASGKAGLYYDGQRDAWYLPVGSAPSTHIVKQSHVRLNGIVTNEQLSMMTAQALGIDVPRSFIVNMGTAVEEDVLFAVQRYDRIFSGEGETIDGLPRPRRLHQEDFAQALDIAAADKYETIREAYPGYGRRKNGESYLSRMFGLLRRCSANPLEDQVKLWRLLIFDYLIGNTDSHIKNFSLLYGADLRTVRLAPAYDVVSTTIYEESTRNMALQIGGEQSIDRITESSFKAAAEEAGLGGRMAMRCFEELCGQFEQALAQAADQLAQEGFDGAREIQERILQTGGAGMIL